MSKKIKITKKLGIGGLITALIVIAITLNLHLGAIALGPQFPCILVNASGSYVQGFTYCPSGWSPAYFPLNSNLPLGYQPNIQGLFIQSITYNNSIIAYNLGYGIGSFNTNGNMVYFPVNYQNATQIILASRLNNQSMQSLPTLSGLSPSQNCGYNWLNNGSLGVCNQYSNYGASCIYVHPASCTVNTGLTQSPQQQANQYIASHSNIVYTSASTTSTTTISTSSSIPTTSINGNSGSGSTPQNQFNEGIIVLIIILILIALYVWNKYYR